MKKALVVVGILCVLVGLGVSRVAFGNGAFDGEEAAMMVSPHTIVLAKIGAVTVHTNIPAGSVVWNSVELNGVAAAGVWADDCGDLVARFIVADLNLTADKAVTMTLTGTYDNDADPPVTFSAKDVVRVK